MIVGASSLITPLAYQLLRRPFSLKMVAISTALATAAGYLLDPYLGQKTNSNLPKANNFKKLPSTFSTLDAFIMAHNEDLLKGTWFKSPPTQKTYHLTLFEKEGSPSFLRVIEDSAEKSLSPYERKFWVFTSSGELPILKDQEKLNLETMIPTLAEVSISTKNDAEPLFSCPLFYRFTDQFNQSYMDVLLNHPTLFPNEFIAHLYVGSLSNILVSTDNLFVVDFAGKLAQFCQRFSACNLIDNPLKIGNSLYTWNHIPSPKDQISTFVLKIGNNENRIHLVMSMEEGKRSVEVQQIISNQPPEKLFTYLPSESRHGETKLQNYTSNDEEKIDSSPLRGTLQVASVCLKGLLTNKVTKTLGHKWHQPPFPKSLQRLTLLQQFRVAFASYAIPQEDLNLYYFKDTVIASLSDPLSFFDKGIREKTITISKTDFGPTQSGPFVTQEFSLSDGVSNLKVVIDLYFWNTYLSTYWELTENNKQPKQFEIRRPYDGDNMTMNDRFTNPEGCKEIKEIIERWTSERT